MGACVCVHAYIHVYIYVNTHICFTQLYHLPLLSCKNFKSLLVNNEYFHYVIYFRCNIRVNWTIHSFRCDSIDQMLEVQTTPELRNVSKDDKVQATQ